MPNLYWTRKAKKAIETHYGATFPMEVFDYGARAGLAHGDKIVMLRPDDDYLAKAIEVFGEPVADA